MKSHVNIMINLHIINSLSTLIVWMWDDNAGLKLISINLCVTPHVLLFIIQNSKYQQPSAAVVMKQ